MSEHDDPPLGWDRWATDCQGCGRQIQVSLPREEVQYRPYIRIRCRECRAITLTDRRERETPSATAGPQATPPHDPSEASSHDD